MSAWASACGGDDSGVSFTDAGSDSTVGAGGSAGASGNAGRGGAGGGDSSAGRGGSSGTAGDGGTGGGMGCDASSQCGSGQTCDPQSHRCTTSSSCKNSLDCVNAPDNKKICDTPSGKCVECTLAADCPENHDCVAQSCVPYTPCTNSLDCPTGLVCDTARGRCVECVVNADCGEDRRCVGNVCRRSCASDNECTPFRLLCNRADGYCVECVQHRDCAASEYCRLGVCAPDICTPGASSCQGNAIVICDEAGSGNLTPSSCASNQSCTMENGIAVCKTRVCTPSVTTCATAGESVVSCSADGLTQTTIDNCAARSQVCVSAVCKPVVCTAGQLYCSGNEVRRCSTKGDTYTIYQTCTTSQYCNTATSSCAALVCTPNQPACNNNVATTCNATGSGYVTGGTDCGAQFCVSGTCQSALFADDFEDGNFDGWTVGTGAYTRTVTNTTAAGGTAYSFQITKASGSIVQNDGVYRTITAVSPTTISWWGRVSTTATYQGFVYIYPTTTVSSYVFYFYFNTSNNFTINGVSGGSYTANTWYHFELRNINWTNRRFDFYVDNALVASQVTIQGSGTSIQRIDLFPYSVSTSNWDEIVFK